MLGADGRVYVVDKSGKGNIRAFARTGGSECTTECWTEEWIARSNAAGGSAVKSDLVMDSEGRVYYFSNSCFLHGFVTDSPGYDATAVWPMHGKTPTRQAWMEQ